MDTYYNRKDIISFGAYLLSEERKKLRMEDEPPESISWEDYLSEVYMADFESWMKRQKK